MTKPAPVAAEDRDRWPRSVELSLAEIEKVLGRKPVVWVGEGLSVSAGYPSSADLIGAMQGEAKGTLDTSGTFFEIADRFVEDLSNGALSNLLQRHFGMPRAPTSVHHAIARLAKAGRVHTIVTTNPDMLVENALREAGVTYLLQTHEENASTTGNDDLRVLKIHGSLASWRTAILSGRSYAEARERYDFLRAQLDILLRQNAVLLLGCSLQEPPLLDWLARLTEGEHLEIWRAVLTEKAWLEAMAHTWPGGHASGVLTRAKVRPLLIARENDLPRLLGEAAAALPDVSTNVEIDIFLGPPLRASLAGCAEWAPKDPHADPNLIAALAELRERDAQALPVDARRQLLPDAQKDHALLRSLAARVGDTLADALLSPEARTRVTFAMGAASGRTPPLLLLLRVHGGTTDEERRRADRFLALPWELLRLDGEHSVEHGKLDLARDAVVDGARGLDAPQRELSVVATVAAPVDAVRLDYEGECYRLWRAMGAEERRLLITDLGTFEALVTAVQAHRPPVVHITGHGEPGRLWFETEEALSHPVDVRVLVDRLRDCLPRLVFLASCYGASVERTAGATGDHRMVDPAALSADPTWSSAAEMHREGVHQVVAWLGPVQDEQSTRAEGFFYAALARGRTARQAVHEARQRCRDPLMRGDGGSIYPLGWAQLAFYHRGADVPVALASTGVGIDIGGAERERIKQRLDSKHGPVGVERLVHGFVGRRSVRAEAIRRWRKGERMLVVHGPGGFGKTALCAELAPILAGTLGTAKAARVVALDGRFAGQRGDPVMALWEQVAAFGEGDAWNAALARLQEDGITGEAVAGAVLWLAHREGGLLVYLDDAESLQAAVAGETPPKELGAWKDPGLRAFWEKLAAAVGDKGNREKGFGLLASTRYVPEGVPDRACLPLPVMREMDLVRLLRWWPTLGRLGAEDMEWLIARLEGHPRSAQWLEELAVSTVETLVPPGGTFAGDLRREALEKVLPEVEAKVSADMLLPRVIEAVGDSARLHLGRCAVLVGPVPWGAILALQDLEGTGNRLIRAGLLCRWESSGGDGLWAPHNMVSHAAQQIPTERRDAQRRVGRWFLNDWAASPWHAISTVYYLCESGDPDEAILPAGRLIGEAQFLGRYRAAQSWAKRLLDAGASGEHRGHFLVLLVHAGIVMGKPTADSNALLEEALQLVLAEDRAWVMAEQASLCLHLGDPRRALSHVLEAEKLEGSNERPDRRTLRRLLLHGHIFKELGMISDAIGLVARAVKVAKSMSKAEESLEIAVAHKDLGAMHLNQGNIAAAEENLLRAKGILLGMFKDGAHPEVISVHQGLGRVLMARKEFELAIEQFHEAIDYNQILLGTTQHQEIADAYHEIAFAMLQLDRLDGAERAIAETLRIETALYGPKHLEIAKTLTTYALVLGKLGRHLSAEDALTRALIITRRAYGPNHYQTGLAASKLGAFIIMREGHTAEDERRALGLLRDANGILQEQCGPDDPDAIFVQQLLDRV